MDWLANLLGSVANGVSLAHFQPRMPRARRVAWGLWVPIIIGIVQAAEHGEFMTAGDFFGMNIMTLTIGAVVVIAVDSRKKYIDAKAQKKIRQLSEEEI